MEYDFKEIEKKWQDEWRKRSTYKVEEDKAKKKFYVLDMFPYPSGAGLHVGHPLGYIASDIFARYKKHRGFNVLHPMGYDSFGLPAEQYAIQTGQHPAITTKNNIARYREQLDKIGFCYDWSREVRTSDPAYYKWTQWIFNLIFNSWYNKETDKVEHINTLIKKFSENGTYNVNAAIDENWYKQVWSSGDFTFFGKDFCGEFTATDWHSMTDEQREKILMFFRMTYLADSVVNWCPALGTVLANDEVKDGLSERGGHPVEQKLMRQWSMRISAYAERLLQGLDKIDWSESIKEVQRNWIGKSEGASVHFAIDGFSESIEVFTTRPDTIFGVSFMTLAPEHQLVLKITTPEYRDDVEQYIAKAKLKTERDRQSDVKNVSGQFTGAYALHPFTGEKIPVWIGEYVLAGYGTGAVMAVPAGDQRDWDFAKKYDLPIPNIFADTEISEKAEASKDAKLMNSQFLDGLSYKEATPKIIAAIEDRELGKGKINYRMRDAVFSRQRYWGEPIPVYYKNELPYIVDTSSLPIELPEVDKYLPTEDGEPPLARAKGWEYRTSSIKYNSTEPHPQPLSRGEGSDSADGIASGFIKTSDKNAPHPQPLSRGEGSDYVPGDDAFSNNELDQLSEADAEYQNLYEEGGRVWQTANPKKWEFLKEHARSMRKEQTLAEKILWERLRNNQLGIHFRRQHAIGPFIVDFANLSNKLIIEVDGGIHETELNKEYDITRDDFLGNLGFKVIRFKNEEVLLNIGEIISQISRIIPLSSGEGLGVRPSGGIDNPTYNENFASSGEGLGVRPSEGIDNPTDNENIASYGEGLGVRPSDGLGKVKKVNESYPLEYNTMPGWAGSSWYFLRYMDANNEKEFASREKINYWGQVDLYMGGAEHGTGHLLYSRFWTKILFDHGYIGFDEPFQKMINQGMITGRSSFVYRALLKSTFQTPNQNSIVEDKPVFVSYDIYQKIQNEPENKSLIDSVNEKIQTQLSILNPGVKMSHVLSTEPIGKEFNQIPFSKLNVEISLVENDILNKEGFQQWRPEYNQAIFICNDNDEFICDWEIEKMSKSKYNVQTPDELVEKFGADTLRCYEMFLGPVEQSKPWDTKGINGVHNFLRKFWRLYHNANNELEISEEAASKAELKTLHKTIKKITEDLDRFSWNTCVSGFMICVNELQDHKCNKRNILESLAILLSPFAPHIAEEIWEKLGHKESITQASWPQYDEAHLTEDEFSYPVSFNGKTRFFLSLPVDMSAGDVEKMVLADEQSSKYLEGKAPKKVIVVPKRIVNVVV